MHSTDHALFRATFRSFLGEERYRRFVAAGTRPRLKYWQEAELKEFFRAHPEHQIDPKELEAALSICELHDVALQSELVDVLDGCVDYSLEYLQARRDAFPHAAADPVSTEGRTDMPARTSVSYCTKCRAARAIWANAHRR
jgi:hypothetical protein